MSCYSKEERQLIYKEMLSILRDKIAKYGIPLHIGFCRLVILATEGYTHRAKVIKNPLKDFPELMKYKPKELIRLSSGTWWYNPLDTKRRIQILKELTGERDEIIQE